MEIMTMIIDNLPHIFKKKDINISSTNGKMDIEIANYKYYIKISLDVIDNFYTIRLENKNTNQVYFLTQSRKYHKDVKKYLHQNKLSKEFKSHVLTFVMLTKDYFDGIKVLEYSRNLKFDGIFM